MGSQIYAVLTGDVINSESLKRYGESLDEVIELFERDYQDELPLKVDRYSGDRLQTLLSDPHKSLRAAVYLFTWLASLESPVPIRISIGVGRINGVPDERVSTGEGEAFRLSGLNLDNMKKYQRITFEANKDVLGRKGNSLISGSMDLLSGLLMDLSPAQAEVIWYKLRSLTQEEIAQETGRRQQSVSDILIAGYWRNLEGFLEVFEEQFQKK